MDTLTFRLLCFISFWLSFLVDSRFFLLPLLRTISLMADELGSDTLEDALSLSWSLTSPSSSSSSSVGNEDGQ